MKEIDFLPEWYKSGRRRQINFRTQYIVLGGMFVVMLVWSLLAAHSVSKQTAQLAEGKPKLVAAEAVGEKFNKIKSEIKKLQNKTELLEKLDSKIDVASVLAEISFLIGEKIVLSKVEFDAEEFDSPQPKSQVYRAVRTANPQKPDESLLGMVRFKVLLGGVAVDSGEVAELVCRLEDSPYFCLVCPSFSRNRGFKTGNNSERNNPNSKNGVSAGEGNFQTSEFEIGCYLANYRQQGPGLAKQMQNQKP